MSRRDGRTLAKASATTFAAGDRILLQGSAPFQGSLNLDSGDTATALAPITVSPCGTGRAPIQAGNGNAIGAGNTAGLSISNLHLATSSGLTGTATLTVR